MTIAEESKKFHADNRGNCAMSVAYGYAIATGKSETEALEIADKFKNAGRGIAPGGLCGALYAAKELVPEKAAAIEEVFCRETQNFTKCAEIRPNKILPCNRCVELAGEALDLVNP
jgi:hypothetical protein